MDKAATIVSMASLVIASMNLSLSIVFSKKSKERWAQWNIVLAATLLAMAVFYTLNLLSGFLFTGIPLVVLRYVFDAFYIIDTSFIVVFICRFASWQTRDCFNICHWRCLFGFFYSYYDNGFAIIKSLTTSCCRHKCNLLLNNYALLQVKYL